jgi:hypothetical protein
MNCSINIAIEWHHSKFDWLGFCLLNQFSALASLIVLSSVVGVAQSGQSLVALGTRL